MRASLIQLRSQYEPTTVSGKCQGPQLAWVRRAPWYVVVIDHLAMVPGSRMTNSDRESSVDHRQHRGQPFIGKKAGDQEGAVVEKCLPRMTISIMPSTDAHF